MKYRLTTLTLLLSLFLITHLTTAQSQQTTPTAEPDDHAEMGNMESMATEGDECNVEAFVLQQQAYATALTAFAQVYSIDPQSALRTVYYAGLTYQTFAESCGFVPPEEEHGHGDETVEDEHSDAAHLELALSIGDPENGEVLFNTIIPETGFACATCHRVDSSETLIGPGLINVASPDHDPAQHEHGTEQDDTHEDTDAAHGGDDHNSTEEPITERSMEDIVTYIHTSIISPSEFVVPGFPDLLMPQIYEQVLSEQQINDLIAYLLVLPS